MGARTLSPASATTRVLASDPRRIEPPSAAGRRVLGAPGVYRAASFAHAFAADAREPPSPEARRARRREMALQREREQTALRQREGAFQTAISGSQLHANAYVPLFDEHLAPHYRKPRVRRFFRAHAIVETTLAELGGPYRDALVQTSLAQRALGVNHAARRSAYERQHVANAHWPPAESPHSGHTERYAATHDAHLHLEPRTASEHAVAARQLRSRLREEEYTRVVRALARLHGEG